ncbi:hypothetical protein [Capnocytophaga cynodegmi]|uniref:hypothetical protein n=1 Tax=Capnocytophaga cynodegmi TaxID=28189 RepID=UPI00385E34BA
MPKQKLLSEKLRRVRPSRNYFPKNSEEFDQSEITFQKILKSSPKQKLLSKNLRRVHPNRNYFPKISE